MLEIYIWLRLCADADEHINEYMQTPLDSHQKNVKVTLKDS